MANPKIKGRAAQNLHLHMPNAALTSHGLADVLSAKFRQHTDAEEIDRVETDLGAGAVEFRVNRAGFRALLQAKQTLRRLKEPNRGEL